MADRRSERPRGQAATIPSKRIRSSERQDLRGPPRLSVQGDDVVVWLGSASGQPRRVGQVNRILAADAGRHGQDLVGELVDVALREAERAASS